METRQKELSQLNAYIEDVDKEVTMILQSLQWDRKHLLEGFMVSCKYDESHRVPVDRRDQHEAQCLLKRHGYTKEDKFLPDPLDQNAPTIVKLSNEDIAQILQKAVPISERFRKVALTIWIGPREEVLPLTAERLQSVYSVDERRVIHDAVVSAAPSIARSDDDILLLSGQQNTAQKGEKSRFELLAELRDMKRRRAKYRTANISGKYSNVLRDVIKTQMDLYYEALGLPPQDDITEIIAKDNSVIHDNQTNEETSHTDNLSHDKETNQETTSTTLVVQDTSYNREVRNRDENRAKDWLDKRKRERRMNRERDRSGNKGNRESDRLGNRESDRSENRESDRSGNRESGRSGNRGSGRSGNIGSDRSRNRESDRSGNRESDSLGNRGNTEKDRDKVSERSNRNRYSYTEHSEHHYERHRNEPSTSSGKRKRYTQDEDGYRRKRHKERDDRYSNVDIKFEIKRERSTSLESTDYSETQYSASFKSEDRSLEKNGDRERRNDESYKERQKSDTSRRHDYKDKLYHKGRKDYEDRSEHDSKSNKYNYNKTIVYSSKRIKDTEICHDRFEYLNYERRHKSKSDKSLLSEIKHEKSDSDNRTYDRKRYC